MSQENQQKQKQKQKFENSWKQIIQMTATEAPEKVKRIARNEVVEIFEELAKERIETARAEFKEKLKGLLTAKRELDKRVTEGRKKLEQEEEKQYETLNKELNDVVSLLENVKKEAGEMVDVASGNFKSDEEQPTEQ